jgi:hypothetical protein
MTARIIFAALLVTIGVAGWIFWPRIAQLLDGPSPTQDDEPDDREAGEPVEHEGATEGWGAKLSAMRNMPLPVELCLKPAEQMEADHEDLAEIGRALDHFGTVMTDALSRFLRNQPQTLLRLPSSIEHTGELPVVEMVGV